MSVLGQCLDIINLTSLDWSDRERFGVVGHSVRVMAKAKNYDEMVVGLMQALYAGSSYTRGLYDCDVDGDPEWQTALDLFVPPLKLKKFRTMDDVPDEYLLQLNLPQNLSDEEREAWMLNETLFSFPYEKYIRKISANRIARNVMIHKLEDMLGVLQSPGEFGDAYYVLPWKKHYRVTVNHLGLPVPKTDDTLLLRSPTDVERKNLIEKYMKALDILRTAEERFPVWDDYSEEEHLKHEQACLKWFDRWVEDQKMLEMECYGVEEDYDDAGPEELPN